MRRGSPDGWAFDILYSSIVGRVEPEGRTMDSALLQNLLAGAGSSSQLIGGLVVALLYVVIGLLAGRLFDGRRSLTGFDDCGIRNASDWAEPKSCVATLATGIIIAAAILMFG